MTTPTYHVDAETRTAEGEIFADFHLETPNQAEAEHAFLDCWFRRTFWSVRIWKEWEKN